MFVFQATTFRGFLAGVLLALATALLDAQAPAPSPPPQTEKVDPLGRGSPLGTLTGFSAAARRDDFAIATRYLQAGGRSAQQAENLARDLSELLDRYFVDTLTSVSSAPVGALDDGLPQGRERIELNVGDRAVDLFLVRVPDPDTGPIWLVSSDSLSRVPTLLRSPQATVVEQLMPKTWIDRTVFGISLAQWVLWALTILVPFALFSVLALAVTSVLRRTVDDLTRRALVLSWWKGVRWLLIVGLTLVAHLAWLPFLGFSLSFRYVYGRYALTLGVIVFALLLWPVLTVSFQHARLLALRRGRSDTRSLLLLGERLLKVVVALGAVLILLTLAGVNTTTALAGVGLLGVAVALGAQRSIENLLGGVFLLGDRALAVGDFCRITDRVGWIEDVTLRSVKLRTLDQTLLSIPAGVLAQGGVENFATRGKILIETILRLRYGTSARQLHAVLDGVRRLLASSPDVEQESARIRLINFGAQAIELELFAYIRTADFDKFLAVREQLLLAAAAVIESAGAEFALPTQFVYMRAQAPESYGTT